MYQLCRIRNKNRIRQADIKKLPALFVINTSELKKNTHHNVKLTSKNI